MKKELFIKDWYFNEFSLDSTFESMSSSDSLYPVDIPHDWMIYHVSDLYKNSIGFYRKSFEVTVVPGHSYILRFEGVYMDSTIYLNGAKIFEWKYGYSTFDVDLTPFLINGVNILCVSCKYQSPNSRWYSGAGIYRKVWLYEKEESYFTLDGIYISASKEDPYKVSDSSNEDKLCVSDRSFKEINSSKSVDNFTDNNTLRSEDSIGHNNGSKSDESFKDKISSKMKDIFRVTIESEVISKKVIDAKVKHTIRDKNDNVVFSCCNLVSANSSIKIDSQSFLIEAPHLWDISDPYLYTVNSELIVDNQVVDSVENPLGFRTIRFDSDNGFFLNDRSVKINGVCQHHDLGALGSAMNKTALRRQFEKLIKMGVNSIRTSHNMPAVEVMELADEMGILIYSESFDMWELPKTTYDYGNYFPEWYERDVRSWVRRDRNHPCLFIWGIGNEIYDTHAGNGLKWTRLLRDSVKKYDYNHNAYIGIGSNYIEWDNAQKCSDELELSGYNYGERLYDEHHKKYPNWCIFGSETASTVQSRGIYHFPYEIRILTYQDGQCSCLGNCTTNWGAKSAAWVIAEHRNRDFIFGQYLWTGWDYIGEPTPYHSKNSFFGQIDTAGFEKDTFYQYQAEWTDAKSNPMVHLLPYWDFNEGQEIDVCAYSNGDSVELFFNGVSLGRQTINHHAGSELQGHWKLPYHEGELIVKAYDEEGKEIASDSTRSFGDAASINLKPDKTTLIANGEDLIFIEISMSDSSDTFVANAKNRVTVKVEGPGRLVGLDNGDSTDYEEYKGDSRRLFSGKLLAIIAATDKPGDIKVTVSSVGLKDSVCNLTAVKKGCKIQACFDDKNFSSPVLTDVPIRKIELISQGTSHLSKEQDSTKVLFKIYPENATYRNVTFKALTKDAVDANFAHITVEGNTATITALGDGEFTLTAFANNDKDHPEILSTLNFDITGMGLATHNGYEMVPGILCSKTHSKDSKLSFLGGVFLPAAKDSPAFVSFENIDLGDFGSDEVHVPLFSFNNEVPISIYLGDLTGECLYKGTYKATSIYNTYQENIFRLSRRIKGCVTLTFAFNAVERFSMQGFYFTQINKAYERINATENLRITGDTFTIGKDEITSIGNNVCIEFDKMNFDEGISGIKITGKSPNPVTAIHILFFEGSSYTQQMIEIPGSTEYTETLVPLDDIHINCKIGLLFLPGSNFDLKDFIFLKGKPL